MVRYPAARAMHRLLVLFLASCLIATLYALFFGDKNVFDLCRLNREIDAATRDNEQLRQRNRQLAAEVNDLKQGGETVETIARSQLGLIKPGETFFQVLED